MSDSSLDEEDDELLPLESDALLDLLPSLDDVHLALFFVDFRDFGFSGGGINFVVHKGIILVGVLPPQLLFVVTIGS